VTKFNPNGITNSDVKYLIIHRAWEHIDSLEIDDQVETRCPVCDYMRGYADGRHKRLLCALCPLDDPGDGTKGWCRRLMKERDPDEHRKLIDAVMRRLDKLVR